MKSHSMTATSLLKKKPKPPGPPPAKKCGDCGTRFKPNDTRWDVQIKGGTYKTVCTKCFEKNDTGWAESTTGTEHESPPKRRN